MELTTLLLTLLLLAITTLTMITIRLLQILPPRRPPPDKRPYPHPHLAQPFTNPSADPHPPRLSPTLANEHTYLLIVLGSGGHTAEMFALLDNLDRAPSPSTTSPTSALGNLAQYSHRRYLVSAGDDVSLRRARVFEAQRADGCTWDVVVVPRARRVHQSLWTAPASSARCLVACVRALASRPAGPPTGAGGGREKGTATGKRMPRFPNVILTNGPGTGAVVVAAAVLLRFAGWGGAGGGNALRTVYLESFARVTRLSWSGRLVRPVVDRFLVQWPGLARPGSRAEYVGVCVW